MIEGPQDFAAVFNVSRETLDRLEIYAERLMTWQKAVNLVSPGTLDHIWHRHFADSAQLLAYAPAPAAATSHPPSWLDLGAGAGFPGLVIAILAAETGGARIHLVESRARKCAFLREIARETGVSVEIHRARIESLTCPSAPGSIGPSTPRSIDPSTCGAIDIVTARALAPMGRLLQLAAPFFSQSTTGLFLKGREADAEIAAARAEWHFDCESHPSVTDRQGRIIVIKAPEERVGSA